MHSHLFLFYSVIFLFYSVVFYKKTCSPLASVECSLYFGICCLREVGEHCYFRSSCCWGSYFVGENRYFCEMHSDFHHFSSFLKFKEVFTPKGLFYSYRQTLGHTSCLGYLKSLLHSCFPASSDSKAQGRQFALQRSIFLNMVWSKTQCEILSPLFENILNELWNCVLTGNWLKVPSPPPPIFRYLMSPCPPERLFQRLVESS